MASPQGPFLAPVNRIKPPDPLIPSVIPEFPHFKKLELSDKEAVESFTQHYPPYSDFNFTSMWAWDVKGEMRVSQLNGNLVVRFTDYTTGEPFYSFLGTSNVSDTARKLLDLSVKEDLNPILKLLPEVSASELDNTSFAVQEDRDHFDYIYNIEKLSTYDGNRLRSKRNFFNRFKKRYAYSIVKLDPSDQQVQENIRNLFRVWAANKKSDNKFDATEDSQEWQAVNRIFEASRDRNLIFIGMLINGNLVGFIINELLANDYALLHFEKADDNYIGIYSCLMSENAKILSIFNKKVLNHEQDLGIEGLRLGKRSFCPMYFLKKYAVRGLQI